MLELFSANKIEWQKDEIDLWTCKHCLEAALYSHKQRKVSMWTEAEKYGGPQLSRFTNYLRPKPYTLQQNIPNYWECLFQFGAAQPFFTPWPAGNLDCGTTLEWLSFRRQTFHIQCRHIYKSSETSNARLFTIFPNWYLSFPDFVQVWKIALQISRLFQEFKTLHRPCVRLFFYMRFCFCLEVFHFSVSFCFCFEVCGFAVRFLVLPWSICFCRKERYFLLLWQLRTTVDKGVCSHRLLDSKLALHLHGKLCRYMHSTV